MQNCDLIILFMFYNSLYDNQKPFWLWLTVQYEKKEIEQLHRLTKYAVFDWIIWQFYVELLSGT